MMNTENEWKDVRALVLEEARQPATTRPWTREGATLLLVHGTVALAALIIAEVVYGHSPESNGAGTLLFIGAAFCGVVATLALGRASRLFAHACTGLFAFGAWAHVEARDMWWDAPFWAYADCAVGEVLMAVLPAAATIFALRRFAFRPARALMGGIAAAATGLGVLELTCPSRGAYHALVFHLAPALVVVLVTLAVRRALTSKSHVP